MGGCGIFGMGWAYLDWGVMYCCDGELKRLGVTSEELEVHGRQMFGL